MEFRYDKLTTFEVKEEKHIERAFLHLVAYYDLVVFTSVFPCHRLYEFLGII